MVNEGDKLHPESLVKYLGIHVRPASEDGKHAERKTIALQLPNGDALKGGTAKIERLFRRMVLATHTSIILATPSSNTSSGQQFIDAVNNFEPFIDAGVLTEEDLASALDILYGEGFAERFKAQILREAANPSLSHTPLDNLRSPE